MPIRLFHKCMSQLSGVLVFQWPDLESGAFLNRVCGKLSGFSALLRICNIVSLQGLDSMSMFAA
jgi:hypothetical protein